MHHALSIPEIIGFVVNELNGAPGGMPRDLCALARTSRALSEPALDTLWAQVSAWNLAQRMEKALWVAEQPPPPAPCESKVLRLLPRVQKSPAHMFGSRFEFYAKRVRSLSTDPYVRSRAGKLTVDASVLRAWAAQPELFPCLRELISLRGISTINCAQVLSEFCAMSAITSLTVPADTLVALAGSTARLWPSLQKLVVHDGSVDTSIREQWPRIFSETLTSASTLRHLELRLVVPVPDHIHLIASMRTLTVLKLWVSAVLPDLPSHAFPALRTLLVHEIGWSGGPQHVLRACSSKSLRDLDLSFISGCGGKDQVDEIREALSLIASHVHLCTLTLGFFMPRLSSTGQSEEFGPFLHALGALPHLEVITITSLFVQLALNFDDVLVALNCFPRLKEWHLRSAGAASSSELGKCAPVSLRQFLELLRHRPNIIKLPVAIASPELPCDDTLSSFGTHRCENVTIMAAGDTPEMQHIVQRLFPRTVPPEQYGLESCPSACSVKLGVETEAAGTGPPRRWTLRMRKLGRTMRAVSQRILKRRQ